MVFRKSFKRNVGKMLLLAISGMGLLWLRHGVLNGGISLTQEVAGPRLEEGFHNYTAVVSSDNQCAAGVLSLPSPMGGEHGNETATATDNVVNPNVLLNKAKNVAVGIVRHLTNKLYEIGRDSFAWTYWFFQLMCLYVKHSALGFVANFTNVLKTVKYLSLLLWQIVRDSCLWLWFFGKVFLFVGKQIVAGIDAIIFGLIFFVSSAIRSVVALSSFFLIVTELFLSLVKWVVFFYRVFRFFHNLVQFLIWMGPVTAVISIYLCIWYLLPRKR